MHTQADTVATTHKSRQAVLLPDSGQETRAATCCPRGYTKSDAYNNAAAFPGQRGIFIMQYRIHSGARAMHRPLAR